MKQKKKGFVEKHPYATAAAVGGPAGALHGVWKGAANGYAVAKHLQMPKAAARGAIKAAMKSNALISAATGAVTAAGAIYGFKIRKKHPISGGYLAGGIHGAIGSKIHSYSEERAPMKTFKQYIEEARHHDKSFSQRHPYATAGAIGAVPGYLGGTVQGAAGAYRGASVLGLGKAHTKSFMKYGMKVGGPIGAAAGAAGAALATYGYKIRKNHPATGGFLSGGINGAIGSKVHSYREERMNEGIGKTLGYMAKAGASYYKNAAKVGVAAVKSGSLAAQRTTPAGRSMMNRAKGMARTLGMNVNKTMQSYSEELDHDSVTSIDLSQYRAPAHMQAVMHNVPNTPEHRQAIRDWAKMHGFPHVRVHGRGPVTPGLRRYNGPHSHGLPLSKSTHLGVYVTHTKPPKGYYDDMNFDIHGYHEHQQSEINRAKATLQPKTDRAREPRRSLRHDQHSQE